MYYVALLKNGKAVQSCNTNDLTIANACFGKYGNQANAGMTLVFVENGEITREIKF